MKELSKAEIKAWFQDYATTILLTMGECGEFEMMSEAETEEINRLKDYLATRIGFGNSKQLERANKKLDTRQTESHFPQ